MASWQAKLFGFGARLIIRRRRWGKNARELSRRARRLFGAPKFFQWLETFDSEIKPVNENDIRGEWIIAKPSNALQNGIVFYLHGGGYVSCSPATHRPITAALARLTKLSVFALDYRLAPEHRFPAALDDAFTAYQWLIEQNFSSDKIAFAGDSAGGGLVISLILRLHESAIPLPACAVCLSPWTDLTASGESIKTNAKRDTIFYPQNVFEFASAYLGNETSPANKYASPVFADREKFPPLLFQVGADEILLDDSRRIHQKILESGGVSELEIYEGVFHGWQLLNGLIPESGEALQKAAAFINRYINNVS